MSHKLIKCKACSGVVSKNAKNCPSCGEPTPKISGLKIFLLTFFGLPILIGLCTTEDKPTKSKPASSQKAQKKKPKSTPKPQWLVDAEKKFGPIPKPSAWDGSYNEVNSFLKMIAKDPDSISIQSCTQVSRDESKGWLVGCSYRGNNSFGGKILNFHWFIIKNGAVLDMVDASKYSLN